MTRVQKIITDFKKLREAGLVPAAEFIVVSMTDNAAFPNPPVKLAELKTLLDSYIAALAEAASRDRNKIAIKNQLRQQLNEALSENGVYVNLTAKGDVPMLVSSGYRLAKQPQPRYVSVPENLTLTPGANPGTLVSKVKADKGANGYTHMLTKAPLTPESQWQSVTTSRCRYEFTGLEVRTEYIAKVVAIGSNDQVACSATINKFTL